MIFRTISRNTFLKTFLNIFGRSSAVQRCACFIFLYFYLVVITVRSWIRSTKLTGLIWRHRTFLSSELRKHWCLLFWPCSLWDVFWKPADICDMWPVSPRMSSSDTWVFLDVLYSYKWKINNCKTWYFSRHVIFAVFADDIQSAKIIDRGKKKLKNLTKARQLISICSYRNSIVVGNMLQ